MRDDDCKVVMPLKGLMSAWMTPRVDDSPRLCRKSPTPPPCRPCPQSICSDTSQDHQGTRNQGKIVHKYLGGAAGWQVRAQQPSSGLCYKEIPEAASPDLEGDGHLHSCSDEDGFVLQNINSFTSYTMIKECSD